MAATIPAHVREQQINDRPNISFVRWVGEYKNSYSKAVCRCVVDGYEWSATVSSLLNGRYGCPQCSGKRRWTAEERIEKINALPNISFVRWVGEYTNSYSKAVCRCDLDGYEWSANVDSLIRQRSGCHQCCGRRRWTADERVEQINKLENIRFVSWVGEYKKHDSKANVRCSLDNCVWSATVNNLINSGQGCPQCAKNGYNRSKPGTLYALRSECGTMVKIGISNNYKQRHRQLASATPFGWSCIELLHSDDGAVIAEMEKELHSWTEQAIFCQSFSGSTEWRKWDDRIPMWIEEYRARA